MGVGWHRVCFDRDSWCSMHRMFAPSHRSLDGKTCINCKEKLKTDEEIVLLVNNGIFFPNCIIHASCMEDMGGEKDCLEILARRYRKSKELIAEADRLW